MPEKRLIRSVQRRVALVSALAAGTALILGVIGFEWAERVRDRDMLDARLEQMAQTIQVFVSNELRSHGVINAKTAELPREDTVVNSIYSIQVWLPDGSLLFQNHGELGSQSLTGLDRFGFDTVNLKGEKRRTYSMQAPDGSFVVQVAERLKQRGAGDAGIILGYHLLTVLLTFGLSMFGTWFLLRRNFRVLDALAERLKQHHLLDIAPLRLDQSPKEFAPVLQAVNSLFQRTGSAFAMEQRFTAMAAHELRTPWAGIRAQAQIARQARDNEELQQALQAIIQGVDRASHVFDQLFDLTRIESMSKDVSANFQHVHFPLVYQQVMEELASKAAAKKIRISAAFFEENMQGLDFAIFTLLRNLMSNAILYTPEGGKVEVCVRRHAADVILTVDDSGKGIPAEAREQAFERFNRLGQRGTEGVGLGLSIVAQVAQLHQAEIALGQSTLGGLLVEVTFKRPD